MVINSNIVCLFPQPPDNNKETDWWLGNNSRQHEGLNVDQDEERNLSSWNKKGARGQHVLPEHLRDCIERYMDNYLTLS